MSKVRNCLLDKGIAVYFEWNKVSEIIEEDEELDFFYSVPTQVQMRNLFALLDVLKLNSSQIVVLKPDFAQFWECWKEM